MDGFELSEAQRQAILLRAGLDPDNLPMAPPVIDSNAWGFPSVLEDARQLLKQHARQPPPPPQQQQLGQEQRQHAPQHQNGKGSEEEQQERHTPLLQLLEQSRTFQSPDCGLAMAEALGVADLYRGLRGSLAGPGLTEGVVQSLRAHIKGLVNGAWSDEALRRGIELAKGGNLDGALRCYHQALELDPGSADSRVARGAALANQQELQAAADELEYALELAPNHANALQYLEAVRSKAAQRGLVLRPRQQAHQQAQQAQQAQPVQQEAKRPGPELGEPQTQQLEQAAGGRGGLAPWQQAQQRQQQQAQQQEPQVEQHSRQGSEAQHALPAAAAAAGEPVPEPHPPSDRKRRPHDGGGSLSGPSDSSSSGGGSGGSSGGSDSAREEAERLAAAAVEQGGGMDLSKALQLVTEHIRARNVASRVRLLLRPPCCCPVALQYRTPRAAPWPFFLPRCRHKERRRGSKRKQRRHGHGSKSSKKRKKKRHKGHKD